LKSSTLKFDYLPQIYQNKPLNFYGNCQIIVGDRMRFKDRVVLVTGAGRGIGRAIALAFGKEGARVAVNDLNLESASSVVEEIKSMGSDAIAVQADITKLGEVERMVEKVKSELGSINILINNAGYWTIKLFKDTSPEDWQKDIGVCYIGTLNCCKAVINDMIENRYGRIINIVSDAGRIGEPFLAVYSGAKAAVIGFGKALAKEVARYGITVNNIAAGVTKTPGVESFLKGVGGEEKLIKAYPRGRLGEPEDIANGVLFFAADESEYITGQTISISGGYTTLG
jgi:NAD(P)-dependent dehydrogenase (short-subunit alcohol dehydrogenase family)